MKEVGFEMSKKLKISKPLIPFNSREYENKISKLTKNEYELFKKILLGKEIIGRSKDDIKNLYDKLEVNSQIELMARYSKNYYNEFSSENLKQS